MFLCRLYNFNLSEVDQARLEGFYYKGLDFDHLPPSSVALQQHVLRAIYQSGYVWGKCLQSNPEAPGPTNWGWGKCGIHWKPIWIQTDVISKALPQLVTCKCNKVGKPPCKYVAQKVSCTHLCACRGRC